MRVSSLPACPKCTGQLYLEHDFELRRGELPEAVCLQCGWRRAVRLHTAQPATIPTRQPVAA